MSSNPAFARISADEFVRMDFGDRKVELVDGFIYAMTGGTVAHARVQSNIMGRLFTLLEGSPCRPFGSDMGVKADNETTLYPDVSIYCGKDSAAHDADLVSTDPKVIFEVLSPSTKERDQGEKLRRYLALPSVDTVVLVDSDVETIRVVQRLGNTSWRDELFTTPERLELPALGITLQATDIFARQTAEG